MLSVIDRQGLLGAFAQFLASQSYQPHGYGGEVQIALVPKRPQVATDFTGKQGVVTLETLPYLPQPCKRLTKIEIQAVCWASTQHDCGYLSDTIASLLRAARTEDICMAGQVYVRGNLGMLQPPTVMAENELYYGAVPFTVWISQTWERVRR